MERKELISIFAILVEEEVCSEQSSRDAKHRKGDLIIFSDVVQPFDRRFVRNLAALQPRTSFVGSLPYLNLLFARAKISSLVNAVPIPKPFSFSCMTSPSSKDTVIIGSI
jgi:hypothetical protein